MAACTYVGSWTPRTDDEVKDSRCFGEEGQYEVIPLRRNKRSERDHHKQDKALTEDEESYADEKELADPVDLLMRSRKRTVNHTGSSMNHDDEKGLQGGEINSTSIKKDIIHPGSGKNISNEESMDIDEGVLGPTVERDAAMEGCSESQAKELTEDLIKTFRDMIYRHLQMLRK